MLALTRRRYTDVPEECWHVYLGDVHVGVIAIRTGNPHDEDPWGWNCGFYPGSRPGECTSGTAKNFAKARREFERAWKIFFRSVPRPIFRRGGSSGIGPSGNMRSGMQARSLSPRAMDRASRADLHARPDPELSKRWARLSGREGRRRRHRADGRIATS